MKMRLVGPVYIIDAPILLFPAKHNRCINPSLAVQRRGRGTCSLAVLEFAATAISVGRDTHAVLMSHSKNTQRFSPLHPHLNQSLHPWSKLNSVPSSSHIHFPSTDHHRAKDIIQLADQQRKKFQSKPVADPDGVYPRSLAPLLLVC